MEIEPNQLPEDERGNPTNPIRVPPKGLSKDKLSKPPSDLDISQQSTIQERHERPSQKKLSNCIKELAKLIIEFEQIIQSSTLDWDKRLRIALMQRNINYLEDADILTELKEIQELTRLKTNLEQWIKKGFNRGNSK